MPKPRKNETRSDYVKRAIPVIKKEHPSYRRDRVIAQAFGMWEQAKKK